MSGPRCSCCGQSKASCLGWIAGPIGKAVGCWVGNLKIGAEEEALSDGLASLVLAHLENFGKAA